MTYIRHDENNTQVSPQPGSASTSYLGGTTGWSTVTNYDFNADYVARTYNSAAGTGGRNPANYQRHDENNSQVNPGTYQRHDENNSPITTP